MSEEAIRELSMKVGFLSGIMEQSCKGQQETNNRLTTAIETQNARIEQEKKRIDDVVDDVKTAKRVAFGIATGVSLVGGTGASWLAKITGLFKV